jgi:hypothetical protein
MDWYDNSRTEEDFAATHYGFARKHHQDFFNDNIRPFLGIMRASKIINEEAAAVFYGENEFRFTNSAGLMGLDVFLHNIGTRNSELVRRISVSYPDQFEVPATEKGAKYLGIAALNTDAKFAGRWYTRRVVFNVREVLERTGKLTRLRIILPRFPVDEVVVFDLPIDDTKFDNLQVTLASVSIACDGYGHSERDVDAVLYTLLDNPRNADKLVRSPAQKTVEQSGKMNRDWDWRDVNSYRCYKGLEQSEADEELNEELDKEFDEELKKLKEVLEELEE